MPPLPLFSIFHKNSRSSLISCCYSSIQFKCEMATQEFKLRGIERLGLKPGEKREVDVEGIDGAKVLLCNVRGTVSAIGSRCTHYGAPLVKGVLTADGRITCPWHGACFKASNGDIENAPALDALPSFKLIEKNNSVFISGDHESIKTGRRKLKARMSRIVSDEKVVIIGGGSAGLTTIDTLRENGYAGLITMISNEGYLPIDRTKLSKALIDDLSKITLRDQTWFNNGSIEFIEDEATGVDFSMKKVYLKRGNPTSYTKLVLACGSIPKILPLPGFKELDGIFVLRNVHHIKVINEAIGSKSKKIVIIGSSFIGLEIANAITKENHVTVISTEQTPLSHVLGNKVGMLIQKSFENKGVKFYLSSQIEKALPSGNDPLAVGGVELKDGTKIQADLVILGVGADPATSFIKNNCGIKLQGGGYIVTNENFTVPDIKDVYAIGDIAKYPYHGPIGPRNECVDGVLINSGHWNVAQNAGRIAAMHIISPDTKSKPFIPIFWSALGSQLRYCGTPSFGWDDVILRGDFDNFKFEAYYTKGETVVAVGTIGYDPIVAHASELMRCGVMPSKSNLLNDVDILKIEAIGV